MVDWWHKRFVDLSFQDGHVGLAGQLHELLMIGLRASDESGEVAIPLQHPCHRVVVVRHSTSDAYNRRLNDGGKLGALRLDLNVGQTRPQRLLLPSVGSIDIAFEFGHLVTPSLQLNTRSHKLR